MKTPALAVALLFVTLPASAGVGAQYGARDPAICPARNLPRSGAPSPAQAAQYVACESEHEDGAGNLYFVTDVKVQVAPTARAFNYASDSNATQIDPKRPVYDIRGSYREYQCSKKGTLDYDNNPGHACNTGLAPNAKGMCWVTTFGDWHCRLFDISLDLTTTHVPPPK